MAIFVTKILVMHELSIAVNIVELVEEAARSQQAENVSKVVLEIGTLSGIEFDALTFAMTEAVKGSLLQKAEIVYDIIQAVGVCEECCHEFPTDDYFTVCPVCNSMHTSFIKGKELKIKSIDLVTND